MAVRQADLQGLSRSEVLRAWMSDVGLDGSVVTSVVFDHRRIAG